MSILLSFKNGWLISHDVYLNQLYCNVQYMEKDVCCYIKKGLFNIGVPFKKGKGKPVKLIPKHCSEEYFMNLKAMSNLVQDIHAKVKNQMVQYLKAHSAFDPNNSPLEVSSKIYDASGKISINNFVGGNTDGAKLVTINGQRFVFPENCKFYCKDIIEIESCLMSERYDLVVLDPPWWNKYIRRKRAKTNHAYSMIYNNVLKDIPIENLLHDNGVVVVWCTNSCQHFDDLKDIFIKWNICFAARWFWLKVTLEGDPICNFSEPPGKQPFEQIIIGVRNTETVGKIPDHKVIFSVPSALHSHKPPLIGLLRDFIPPEPKCLELFARYLLPNWTSWGLEAIRFQHESLFEIVES